MSIWPVSDEPPTSERNTYGRPRRWNRGSEVARVVLTCGAVSAVALVFPAVSVTGAFSHTAVVYFWIGSSLATLALRNLIRALVSTPETGRPREALIVGSGPRGQRLERELRVWAPEEYKVVGFVDCADHRSPGGAAGELLGTLDQVENILMRRAIDEVLITLPIKSRYAEIQSVLQSCERVGVPARYLRISSTRSRDEPATKGIDRHW